jgi:hypothetical protein
MQRAGLNDTMAAQHTQDPRVLQAQIVKLRSDIEQANVAYIALVAERNRACDATVAEPDADTHQVDTWDNDRVVAAKYKIDRLSTSITEQSAQLANSRTAVRTRIQRIIANARARDPTLYADNELDAHILYLIADADQWAVSSVCDDIACVSMDDTPAVPTVEAYGTLVATAAEWQWQLTLAERALLAHIVNRKACRAPRHSHDTALAAVTYVAAWNKTLTALEPTKKRDRAADS